MCEVASEGEKGREEDGAGGEGADALLIELQVGVVCDTLSHTYTHTMCVCVCVCVCLYMYIYTHTYTRTHVHTYTRTCTRTHTQESVSTALKHLNALASVDLKARSSDECTPCYTPCSTPRSLFLECTPRSLLLEGCNGVGERLIAEAETDRQTDTLNVEDRDRDRGVTTCGSLTRRSIMDTERGRPPQDEHRDSADARDGDRDRGMSKREAALAVREAKVRDSERVLKDQEYQAQSLQIELRKEKIIIKGERELTHSRLLEEEERKREKAAVNKSLSAERILRREQDARSAELAQEVSALKKRIASLQGQLDHERQELASAQAAVVAFRARQELMEDEHMRAAADADDAAIEAHTSKAQVRSWMRKWSESQAKCSDLQDLLKTLTKDAPPKQNTATQTPPADHVPLATLSPSLPQGPPADGCSRAESAATSYPPASRELAASKEEEERGRVRVGIDTPPPSRVRIRTPPLPGGQEVGSAGVLEESGEGAGREDAVRCRSCLLPHLERDCLPPHLSPRQSTSARAAARAMCGAGVCAPSRTSPRKVCVCVHTLTPTRIPTDTLSYT